jgi:hypothetical protein
MRAYIAPGRLREHRSAAMTKANDPTISTDDQESEASKRQPLKGEPLDAEIVRDLDADEAAVEARGGGCASSLTRAACVGE